jgi:hypothetical protein
VGGEEDVVRGRRGGGNVFWEGNLVVRITQHSIHLFFFWFGVGCKRFDGWKRLFVEGLKVAGRSAVSTSQSQVAIRDRPADSRVDKVGRMIVIYASTAAKRAPMTTTCVCVSVCVCVCEEWLGGFFFV